jgi:hypothetical protein
VIKMKLPPLAGRTSLGEGGGHQGGHETLLIGALPPSEVVPGLTSYTQTHPSGQDLCRGILEA